MAPRICVIGTGYLGTAHAVALAEMGFLVLGLDSDPDRVASLQSGRTPFYEPGIDELLARHAESGRLRFTTSYREAAEFGDVHFLCLPTPESAGCGAELKPLLSGIESLARHLDRRVLLVGKSTVPVGTSAMLRERLRELVGNAEIELAWNPEFLREGQAVADSLHPDRLVFGVTSPWAAELLLEIYRRPIDAGVPVVVTDPATAELVKIAANTFLAVKVSFINTVAEFCESVSADVVALAEALGYDPRIGAAHLHAGAGFGGGCLPKDVRLFRNQARRLGRTDTADFLDVVDRINLRTRERIVELTQETCGGSLSGRRVAALGAAFKPHSDDIRDSPALAVARELHARGAIVSVYDPRAGKRAREAFPELNHCDRLTETCRAADVVVHLTEWPEFVELDPAELSPVVRAKRVVDARNCLSPQRWSAAGWMYRALGRPSGA